MKRGRGACKGRGRAHVQGEEGHGEGEEGHGEGEEQEEGEGESERMQDEYSTTANEMLLTNPRRTLL